MSRLATFASLLLMATGCAGARQFVHNGLSYASGSDQQGALRTRMSDAEWRQHQAESQNVASVEAERRFD